MSWGRKRVRGSRAPHPDPRVELQRIENLQASVARYEDVVGVLRESMTNAHDAAEQAELDGHGNFQAISEAAQRRADRMFEQIRETEQAIQKSQALIIEFSDGLADSDLSYLTSPQNSGGRHE